MLPSQERGISPWACPALRRHSMALVLTAVAGAGVAACVWFLSHPFFLVFVAAIFAARAYGGIGPGIVSATVALGLSLYAFLPPHFSWATEGSPWRLVGFYYAAVLVSCSRSSFTETGHGVEDLVGRIYPNKGFAFS